MKHIKAAIILLVLVLTTLAAQEDKLIIKYDRFKDETSVLSGLAHIKKLEQMDYRNGKLVVVNSATPFYHFDMVCLLKFKGQQKPSNIQDIFLSFMTTSKNWQFDSSRDLYVIADGERFELRGLGRTSKVEETLDVVSVREVMLNQVPLSALKKIANAKDVEMRLGTHEFKLTEEHLKLIREFVDYATGSQK